jgi:hypothetical protein
MVVTTAGPHRRIFGRRRMATASTTSYAPGIGVGHFGLGSMSFMLILAAAWGGIIPFVGPVFGYSADGAGSWHWTLTHAVMAVVPGALAVLMGLTVLGSTRAMVVGRGRISLAGAGLVTMACGAWFAVAPWAWPVVDNRHAFFVFASPLHQLADIAGYAVGPGLIIAACGAYFLGWAGRHQEIATATPVRTAVAPATEVPVEAERRAV